ncbi:MAG: MerR family transcriptional regulator [Firmicutes bacterium]|nr:MerR family transcriptional regulator [Bacillota bacterium]
MGELTKIKDISLKYAVTARTLRYYEDIGILTSIRSEGYAHRMYDEVAITRLKQILILRKLNISVKGGNAAPSFQKWPPDCRSYRHLPPLPYRLPLQSTS